jgi:rhodanese-related sulfurtransferase
MSTIENTIKSEELREILSNRPEAIQLVDVREPIEFAQAKIDGCTLVPLSEWPKRAIEQISKDKPVVIYCAHGVRSMQATMYLMAQGYENVRSLTGGIAHYLGIP